MLPLLGLALGLQLPCARNGPSQLSGAASPGVIGRRELGALAGMAVLTLANRDCSAYDSIPTIDPTFVDLEQKRRDQAKEISENKAMIKPYLDKFIGAFDEKSFEAASDNLAVSCNACCASRVRTRKYRARAPWSGVDHQTGQAAYRNRPAQCARRDPDDI